MCIDVKTYWNFWKFHQKTPLFLCNGTVSSNVNKHNSYNCSLVLGFYFLASVVHKQGQLQQVAWDYVWTAFEYLHRRKFQNLSGQPVPLFDHTHIQKKKKKKVFFCFQI